MKRLQNLGSSQNELVDTYVKQVRSILEYCVPVWHPGLTIAQSDQIERVQNCCLQVIMGPNFQSARSARIILKLETLEKRRKDLCYNFAKKAINHNNHTNWFQEVRKERNTRGNKKNILKPTFCRTKRFEKSPIPYLTDLINEK